MSTLGLKEAIPMDYLTQCKIDDLENHPRHHSDGCLSASVDAFCDDVPDPGCTCPPALRGSRAAQIADLKELSADERDAALDAAEFSDEREQDRLDYVADLRYEYSKEEYED